MEKKRNCSNNNKWPRWCCLWAFHLALVVHDVIGFLISMQTFSNDLHNYLEGLAWPMWVEDAAFNPRPFQYSILLLMHHQIKEIRLSLLLFKTATYELQSGFFKYGKKICIFVSRLKLSRCLGHRVSFGLELVLLLLCEAVVTNTVNAGWRRRPVSFV